jgi:5-methylcytosine-specific restriction endonuclease McrA
LLVPRDYADQLGLWDDRTFDGGSSRQFRRSPQQARADYYHVYLGTPQWQCRRREVIERGRFRCARCGKQRRLQVHHKSYMFPGQVGDESPEQLEALCVDCHERVTAEERNRRGC